MQFSDTTTKDGILQDCESILFDDYGRITDSTSFLQTFTRNSNRALDRITQLIFDADGRWQWDDTNFTDYPIATTDVVASQADYVLNVTHLKIHQVEFDGTKLTSIDPTDFDKPLAEVYGSGTPKYYDKIADSVFLYPTPDTAVTDGLKVYFQRPASYFATSDTTKKPGFATHFHRLISLWASYDYAFTKQLPIAKVLRDEIAIMEAELKDFYSQRSKDEHITLKARGGNFR